MKFQQGLLALPGIEGRAVAVATSVLAEKSRVGSNSATVAVIVSDLGGREEGQTIQVQQALPEMEGRVAAVAVPAVHARSAREGE